jgi:hypothetical protein
MSFVQVSGYLDLITSEHHDQPLYRAFLSVFLQGQVDLYNTLMSLPFAFDVDFAVGVQLDQVGVRVGISRAVPTPLTGVYFSWDTDTLGWDQGTWQGAFDPDTGITLLSDEAYRQVIKGKIAANQWNGTAAGAKAAWAVAFGPGLLKMTDNQNMTEAMTWVGPAPDQVTKQLIQLGYFNLAPAGVSVTQVIP